MAAGIADFAKLETERDFYDALPALIKKHGTAVVKESMASLPLTHRQIAQCFKQLAARQTAIVWLHCTTSAAGALVDLAIVITDQSLNEVARNTWALINGNRELCSDEIVDTFLGEHCAPGCTVASPTGTARQLQVLAHELPAVRRYFGEGATIDLSGGGVRRYAELLELPMLATSASPDCSADSFEARMRVGNSPALKTPLAPDARAEDHCEMAILALGWARVHLIAPPKAARYVTLGLNVFSVLLVGSIMHAIALWMAFA